MNITEIALAIIAILSMVVSALIVRIKSKREKREGKEDKLLEVLQSTIEKQDKKLNDMQDRLISKKEFVKREEFERQNREIMRILKEIKEMLKNI